MGFSRIVQNWLKTLLFFLPSTKDSLPSSVEVGSVWLSCLNQLTQYAHLTVGLSKSPTAELISQTFIACEGPCVWVLWVTGAVLSVPTGCHC